MINLSTVSNALKNLYLNPLREDINIKADPFASRILQTSDNITGYAKIVRAAQIGVNGGAGAGTETGALPAAGENLYEQLESDTKNLYGVLEISDKSLKAVKEGPGAFVNAFQQDMDTLLKTLRWNLARQIYGDGTGKLTLVKVQATATKVMECATGSTTQYLLPGLKVDVHAAADGTVGTGNSGLRITDVDHKNGTFTLSSAITVTANDYITIQSSAGYELTGLGKIFESISGVTQTIYGKLRSDYSWLRPYLNASFGNISETGIQEVINLLEDTYNITINHINVGNGTYSQYMDFLNSRRAINDVMVLEGGHKALKFNGMPVVRNKFLPTDCIDLLDTSLFTIDQIADWDWIEGPTHGILNQKAGYPTYTATIAKYCDLMCALPGALARLTGVTAFDTPAVDANAGDTPAGGAT